ncbi:hypothetical protein GUITHDRAFT_165965 [Guillardia theta CCMP2712]|uniref:C2HC zinc finger plants domain-containing protein n=2 Tax=Guillardia theta TaxID=55529 RepID=L1IHZ4_GUITC|nr:hypothetical protein GUITHDRAFT_165965 [Guillardia theta CCMP2712]EKX35430.1 hypothetical protein GUITHDRAFT_165965 [Guillardia theta CCMP2712]|eukprot:XP_005822410.1 hypothetical protein GUITHDRAFT_165965 [Guillardia theta CCMP2712]
MSSSWAELFDQMCNISERSAGSSMEGEQAKNEKDAYYEEMLRQARMHASEQTYDGTLKALAMVTDVIRERGGGEKAVLEALKNARENHQRVVASSARPGPEWFLLQPVGTESELGTEQSLLADSGRERIIMDAAEDGSSVLCRACGALVNASRMMAHQQFWCNALASEDAEMEVDSSEVPPQLLSTPNVQPSSSLFEEVRLRPGPIKFMYEI